MATLSLQIPVIGQSDSTEEPKIVSDLTAISTWANGNIDAPNLSNLLAQSAGVNISGQTTKGAINISASESRTNTAYGTMPTPDQVTGIVLPASGLIAVWYQATWQESVNQAAQAAIFLNSNQMRTASGSLAANADLQAAQTAAGAGVNTPAPLGSSIVGLVSGKAGYTGGDVTTGQAVAIVDGAGVTYNLGGATTGPTAMGGPCYLFAAAGTYTVSVQFKASSGSVTVLNRKLWVEAISFV